MRPRRTPNPARRTGCPYLNPALPPEARAADLVSRTTLEEEVSQTMNAAPAIPRLGIPDYEWWSEALHGVARNGIATVFPKSIGLAATFDTSLMRRVADVISIEGRAKYNEAQRTGDHRRFSGITFWSPNVNIFRDPRWGRGQETFGEDPYLSARMGVQFSLGLQGDDPNYLRLVATPKHYAVHSGPEQDRHHFNAVISDHDLKGHLSSRLSRQYRGGEGPVHHVRVQRYRRQARLRQRPAAAEVFARRMEVQRLRRL